MSYERKTNRPPRGTFLEAVRKAGANGRQFTRLDIPGFENDPLMGTRLVNFKNQGHIRVVRRGGLGSKGPPTVYELVQAPCKAQAKAVQRAEVFWIDTQDHLPGHSNTVLVATATGQVLTGFRLNDLWWFNEVNDVAQFSGEDIHVVAWSDMPKHPEAK